MQKGGEDWLLENSFGPYADAAPSLCGPWSLQIVLRTFGIHVSDLT